MAVTPHGGNLNGKYEREKKLYINRCVVFYNNVVILEYRKGDSMEKSEINLSSLRYFPEYTLKGVSR